MNWTFVEFSNTKDEWARVDIDSKTRRVKFSYMYSDIWYEFSLKSECNDKMQELMVLILKKNKIQTLPVEDYSDYYTIVINSQLPFEK